MTEIDRLREMIDGARRIVAFTGAGISTESGIPDFRSPGGIWTKYQPIYFDDFMSSEEMRRETWRRKFTTDQTMLKAEPNAGHRALAKLVEQGKMSAIITQNMDGLHQATGVAVWLTSFLFYYLARRAVAPRRGRWPYPRRAGWRGTW